MNIDELREENITNEDCHDEFDDNLFQDLVGGDILDRNLNINNQNMEGSR